jgi:hypothetical protein
MKAMRRRDFFVLAAASSAFFIVPATSFAYVGPGTGLSAIGTILALVAAVGLALVGFVWYPLKRLLRKKPGAPAPASSRAHGAAEESTQDAPSSRKP